MIDAFSYAKEYCEVGLCVKASNLVNVSSAFCKVYADIHTM